MMVNGLNINKIVFFLTCLILLFFKPVSFLIIFLLLIPGFLIKNKQSIVQHLIFSLFFYGINILLFNVGKISLSTSIILLVIELCILGLYRLKKGNLKFYQYPDIKKCFVFSFFIFIMIFLQPYFNFSDSAFHLSFLNKMVKNNIFFNYDPFYGENFYDIRYSYSFFIPFLAIISKLIKSIPAFGSNIILTVYNSTIIPLYIFSLISIFLCMKKFFGKVSAYLGLHIFSIVFLFIRSDLYKGFGFSLASYPSLWCICLFSILLIYNIQKKDNIMIFMLSFILSEFHVFYWGFLSIYSLIYVINGFFNKKNEIKQFFIYLSGGISIVFLKFSEYENPVNSFFLSDYKVSILHNFKYSLNGIPGYLPLVALLCLLLTFNIFRKRIYFLLVFSVFLILTLFAPYLSSIININPQKFSRFYQILPVYIFITPLLLFVFRKYKKTIILLYFFIILSGSFFLIQNKGKSTVSNIPESLIKKIISLPEKSLILSDPATSMLITSFSNNNIVYVFEEFSAPSVSDIQSRKNAFEDFLLYNKNEFNADYAFIPPSKVKFLKNIHDLKSVRDTGDGFCLLKLKK